MVLTLLFDRLEVPADPRVHHVRVDRIHLQQDRVGAGGLGSAHADEIPAVSLDELEVARRLMAQAGDADYGVLTLLIQLDYELRDWFKIPPSCFFPAPDVDSACVVLVRRAKPLLAEGHRQAFVKIVKRAFSQRRKMMLKLLKADWPLDKLESAVVELTISPQERAEKLNLAQLVKLTEHLAT